MSTPRWNRALVTGASSGIGTAFARQLAAVGTDLVLVARSGDVLDELAAELREAAGVEVEVLVADLTDEEQLALVEKRLHDVAQPVDLLVNNAGFGTAGAVGSVDVDRLTSEIQLNVAALVRLSHAAVGGMKARASGGILNVASVMGFQPTPQMAVYGATKAFVLSFTEALHEELVGTGVHATALAPGLTRTSFQDVADVDASKLPSALWMEAEPVVQAGLDGVAANRAVVVPGPHNRIAAGFGRYLPSVVTRKAMAFGMRSAG